MRSGTLRMALTAITNEEVAGTEARELTDDEVLKVLAKEAKKRKEAATAYTDAGRPELAAKEDAELAILEAYLPAQLVRRRARDHRRRRDRADRRHRYAADGPGHEGRPGRRRRPRRRWPGRGRRQGGPGRPVTPREPRGGTRHAASGTKAPTRRWGPSSSG